MRSLITISAGLFLCISANTVGADSAEETKGLMDNMAIHLTGLCRELPEAGFDRHGCNKISEGDCEEVGPMVALQLDAAFETYDGDENAEDAGEKGFNHALHVLTESVERSFPTRETLSANENTALYTLLLWITTQEDVALSEVLSTLVDSTEFECEGGEPHATGKEDHDGLDEDEM